MASISVLRGDQQLPWGLRSTWTHSAFSTSHSNPGALRSPRSFRHQLFGSPSRLGGCFPPHLSQWATRSNVFGGSGGQRSRRKPRGAGLVPTVAPRRPRVQLRPVQALGAEGVVSESVQGWRQGTLLGGGVSRQSRGREQGGEPHRANVRTMRLGWSHWAQETCPWKCGAACCHEGWAWPGRFPDPSGLLAPSALVRRAGPGAARAECNRPERPKAGGVWAGLGVPT